LMSRDAAKMRGIFKYLVLYVLRDRPLHGYGIMKSISELLGIGYVPSSGVLYPTLRLLEREGLVEVRTEGRRKIYALTPKGMELIERERQKVEQFVRKVRRANEVAKIVGLDRLYELAKEMWERGIEPSDEDIEEIRKHIKAIIEILERCIERYNRSRSSTESKLLSDPS